MYLGKIFFWDLSFIYCGNIKKHTLVVKKTQLLFPENTSLKYEAQTCLQAF